MKLLFALILTVPFLSFVRAEEVVGRVEIDQAARHRQPYTYFFLRGPAAREVFNSMDRVKAVKGAEKAEGTWVKNGDTTICYALIKGPTARNPEDKCWVRVLNSSRPGDRSTL